MSKETEKLFKELDKFMADKNIKSEEDANAMINEFISIYNMSLPQEITEEDAETSDDFLELAESAPTKKKALKYAKKALELDDNNIDAEVMVAELSAKTSEEMLEKYQNLIDKTTVKLTEQGYFDEDCVGRFWGLLETRPYMRLRDKYADLLVDCGRMRLAIKEYEEMLRLCENDNLGARYRLMHLYVYLEDEDAALELLRKYEDEESTQFLLPLSILYYKLGNIKESTKYLKRLKRVNKDTYMFFDSLMKGDPGEYINDMSPYGYRPFSIEEFLVECDENDFLLKSVVTYYEWALKKLKTMK